MDEPKPDSHNRQAENEGGNADPQSLVHNVDGPPSNEAAAAPETHAKSQHDPSTWAQFREAAIKWLNGYWHAERKKPKWTETANIILTLGIAIAAFYSAWVFQEQLDATRQTLAAVVTFDYVLQATGFHLSAMNQGQSIARKIKADITLSVEGLPNRNQEGSVAYNYHFRDLLPGFPTPTQDSHDFAIPGYTPETFDAVHRTEKSVTVKGYLSYDEGFGVRQTRKICESYIWYEAKNSDGGDIAKKPIRSVRGILDRASKCLQSHTGKAAPETKLRRLLAAFL